MQDKPAIGALLPLVAVSLITACTSDYVARQDRSSPIFVEAAGLASQAVEVGGGASRTTATVAGRFVVAMHSSQSVSAHLLGPRELQRFAIREIERVAVDELESTLRHSGKFEMTSDPGRARAVIRLEVVDDGSDWRETSSTASALKFEVSYVVLGGVLWSRTEPVLLPPASVRKIRDPSFTPRDGSREAFEWRGEVRRAISAIVERM